MIKKKNKRNLNLFSAVGTELAAYGNYSSALFAF
jgi:hypothetical protein